MYNKQERLKKLIQQLKQIQDDFLKKVGIADIISNSKIFEVLIANSLNHNLIPGHSGSRDAKDKQGREYEYKHFKERSSNHSWTFNDYTEGTINDLKKIQGVIFAHINDLGAFPIFDWHYPVRGSQIADYLTVRTQKIRNARKMINVSPKQIEGDLNIQKSFVKQLGKHGKYYKWIKQIFKISRQIEQLTGTKEILTSNKFWELLVAIILGHKVLSEQAGHDATNGKGRYYEYKVAKTFSWNFQDISKNVLDKYKQDDKIILAIVDKDKFKITKIYLADPIKIVRVLRRKLREKKARFKAQGKQIRRLQVSLSRGDLLRAKAKLVYKL